MNIETTVLTNGLTIITKKFPESIMSTVTVFINAGSRDENKENNGVAHFLEHMAFKGTKTRTALKISQEIEELGANFNAFTDKSITAYHTTGLSKDIKKFVEILGDILCNSVFRKEDIEIERGVILQEYAMYLDKSDDVAHNNWSLTAYPNTSEGRTILGDPEFIKIAEEKHFNQFMYDNYGSNNMVIVGTGNINHLDFVNMVCENFNVEYRPRAKQRTKPCYVGGVKIDTSRPFEQVSVVLGYESLKEKFSVPQNMAANLLGGGMSAPLFQEVREKLGLCYSIYSWTTHDYDYGHFNIGAGTTPENLFELLKVTKDTLINVSQGEFRENDFVRCVNNSLVYYSKLFESQFNFAYHCASSLFMEGKIVDPNDKINEIKLITPSEIEEALQFVLKSKPTVSLVGPVENEDEILKLFA